MSLMRFDRTVVLAARWLAYSAMLANAALPVLAHARGYRVGELVIQHRPRKFGRSKYGVRRFVEGLRKFQPTVRLASFSCRTESQRVAIRCPLLLPPLQRKFPSMS